MKTHLDFVLKELGGLQKIRRALLGARAHSCCACDKRGKLCFDEEGWCREEWCEGCEPHMNYLQTVLDPRIKQLQAINEDYRLHKRLNREPNCGEREDPNG